MRLLKFIAPVFLAAQMLCAAEKPNILFIFTDDLGAADLACTGSDLYRTPNLDKLAAQGVTFTRGYSSAHVCSPTRAALQSGKTPARLHMTDFLRGHQKPYAKLLVPDWTMGLPTTENSFAKVVRPQGYVSAWFGKWHAGEGAQQHGYDAGNQSWKENTKDEPTDPKGVFTLNKEAMDFIEKNPGKPFFIGMSHYSPHGPVRFDPAVRDEYQKIVDAKPDLKQKNAGYAAMIEALDASIGQMLDFLDEKDLAKNTIVIFTSDNGGELNFTNNAPLRMGKGSLYEGGVRVPVIARWPGHLKPGTTNETRVSSIDFLPTIAALVGAPVPSGLDGKDLSAAFSNGETLDRGNLYWHYPHYHATRPSGSILSGDWKLIEWFETGKTELYNIAADPREEKDLAVENPEKAAALLADLKKWREEVGAQMMKENPQYDPARETEGPPKKVNKKKEEAKAEKKKPGNPDNQKKEKKPKAEKAPK
ncbi:MAG: sulfatase [Akkermansiaceae bacterium]|nr:sulfatase [Akkermansiaceae bacterium]